MGLNELPENKQDFFYWISERESIRMKKESGEPKPWTKDSILQRYKFCNVRREDDRVTKWIKEHWRDVYKHHPNLWFGMIVARLFNWPPTLELIGFPTGTNDQSMREWMNAARTKLKGVRDVKGEKVFTGAYLVSTNGVKMDKIDYLFDRVLTPIWEKCASPKDWFSGPYPVPTLQSYWENLTQFDGLGSFMAGQVIADLEYCDPVLEKAIDWWHFAPLGPGSIRGLNRYHGRTVTKSLKQDMGLSEINALRDFIWEHCNIELPAHDIQNCLCEYDKMMRLKLGQGKVRSTYPGV